MIFFLLLTPLPARAEITVTIINGSPLEINYLYLESGEGGMGSSMNLVPGNRINMNDGNASVLRKLTVFAGTESYVFDSYYPFHGCCKDDGRPDLHYVCGKYCRNSTHGRAFGSTFTSIYTGVNGFNSKVDG